MKTAEKRDKESARERRRQMFMSCFWNDSYLLNYAEKSRFALK